MSKHSLTIALTKGRILKETLPLFAAAGIAPLEDIHQSRKLTIDTNQPHIQWVILRGSDVPTYVTHGAADIGVVGKDVLLETGSNDNDLYEPLDLQIARCRLMTAGLPDQPPVKRQLRVATKFITIAKRYFAEQGIPADIIKLHGALELAPLMGLADLIVDIVDTGNTLKANGLQALDLIASISSRLVVNKVAMKCKHQTIAPLIEQLRTVLS